MRQLYHSPLLPSCRKIRILLREKDVEFELIQEDFWLQREAFMALNPAGEMPVLVEPEGLVLSGSYSIAEYLDEIMPERPFMGSTRMQRAEVRRLVDWFDARFQQDVTQNILFEKVFKRIMNAGEPESAFIRTGKQNLLYHLDYIANLVKERYFLAGENLTLADIAAAAHLSCLDYLGDVPWDHNATAREWYSLIKSRPSFRPILADRLAFIRPPAYYANPDF